jgi:hypothetical protein
VPAQKKEKRKKLTKKEKVCNSFKNKNVEKNSSLNHKIADPMRFTTIKPDLN